MKNKTKSVGVGSGATGNPLACPGFDDVVSPTPRTYQNKALLACAEWLHAQLYGSAEERAQKGKDKAKADMRMLARVFEQDMSECLHTRTGISKKLQTLERRAAHRNTEEYLVTIASIVQH